MAYLAKRRRERLANATMTKKEWLIDLAMPALGNKLCQDIRPVDVLKVLQELEARDCIETARRLRGTIGAVFRHAVIIGQADGGPTSSLKGAIATPKVVSRAAITRPEKLGGLLRAIYSFDGHPTTAAALKLMALLFPGRANSDYPPGRNSTPRRPCVRIVGQESCITIFVNGARGQSDNGLRSIFFACRESKSVQLQKQDPQNEAGALIAINEGVVTHDTGRIERGELDHAGRLRVDETLLRAGERRF